MFGEIVFMNNTAAIWFTVVILPLLIALFFKYHCALKKNKKLEESHVKIMEKIGRRACATNVLKDGDKIKFLTIFPAHKVGCYACFVAFIESIDDFVLCGVYNTRMWETDEMEGFTPKLEIPYSVKFENGKIILKKGDRH